MWRVIIFMSLACVGLITQSSVASAQQVETKAETPKREAADRRVALWVLDNDDATKTLAQSVKSTLEENKYQVIEVGELRRTIARQKIAAPSTEEMANLDKLKAALEDGNKAYFYESPQVAIQRLEPLTEQAKPKLAALSHRPDVATLVYNGYATLIRAYIDQDDITRAKRAAKQLSSMFPHKEPSRGSIPQNVIGLIEQEREALDRQGTYLTVQMVNASAGCVLYVNGIEAVERSRFKVDPEGSYYGKMVCNKSQTAAVWPIKVTKGKSEEFSVVDRDPFAFSMADDSFDSRALAEGYMKFVVQLTDLPQVVGLSRAKGKSGDESFLLVRLDERRNTVWSDGTSNRTVLKLLTSVFPEIQIKEQPAVGARDEGRPVWAWVITGIGAAAMIGGGAYGYVQHQESERYRCTPNREGTTPDNCDGTEPFSQPVTNEEVTQFNEDWNTTSNRRWIGVGVMGAGVIMTTVGIVGLVSGGSQESPSTKLEILPTLGGAQVRMRF